MRTIALFTLVLALNAGIAGAAVPSPTTPTPTPATPSPATPSPAAPAPATSAPATSATPTPGSEEASPAPSAPEPSGTNDSSSAATPVPGGADQAPGVEGTFGQPLFNGELRLVPKELRDAIVSDDLSAAPGMKWIVFTASASNGTARALDMQQFNASIVDADGNTFQAQPDKVKPMGGVYGVPPGGQWSEQILYDVPARFVPVKIVLLPYDQKHQAFRITVRAQDYAHS